MKSLLLFVVLSLAVFSQATNIQSLRSQILDVPHKMIDARIDYTLSATSQLETEMGEAAPPAPSPPAPPAPPAPASGDSGSASADSADSGSGSASADSADSAASASTPSSPSASGSSSSEDSGKGTIQHVPMTQRIVVGDKDKNYSPILFNEHHTNFPADGLLKAAKVPRRDSGPVFPIVKHKDGTFTDGDLQPVTPPDAIPKHTVFLEIDQKRVDRGQIEVAAKALAESVLTEMHIQKRQKEIKEQNELNDALNNIKTTFDHVIDEVDVFNARAHEDYDTHKPIMI